MRVAVCIEGDTANDLLAASMRRLCKTILPEIRFYRYSDKKEFLRNLPGHTFDFVYLNIEGGIEEACNILIKLRECDKKVPVFFVTRHWRYMEMLHDVEPIAVIRKPFDKRVFRSFFVDKKTEDVPEDSFFEYFFRKKAYHIRIDDILYFESDGRNIVVHLDHGRRERFIGRLNDVEKELGKNGQVFVRSHQSYLIRRRVIKEYTDDKLCLKNNEILPVSQGRRKICTNAMQ